MEEEIEESPVMRYRILSACLRENKDTLTEEEADKIKKEMHELGDLPEVRIFLKQVLMGHLGCA